ncbi:MAG: aminodeoxychorismate synthase component I [Legionella sp.]|nr:MAG: aminodeoxychorismate synthase component I [Legionella sp.]
MALERLSNCCRKSSTALDLPFQGGAIGYIAYDLGAQLLGIKSQPQLNLHDMPLLDMGLYDWALIVDHHLKVITLFAANQQSSTQAIVAEILALWEKPKPSNKDFLVQDEFKALISQEGYAESFAQIQQALHQGRCYQVNFTQGFQTPYKGDAWEMYKKVSRTNPVPFAAFLRNKQADILSFSPERFMLYEQGNLLTSPIKGTIGRSDDPQVDEQLKAKLAQCPKNRAENVMIVDLSRNDLGKIAKTGTVQVQELCAVQSYKAVHHLVSDITAECVDELEPLDAFLSCFPAGSITGAPKIEAMHIINEEEVYDRGVYCGSIGYFSNHGRFDTNIAIRTLTAKSGILHLAAGGGIVMDSQAQDEYQECFTKIAAIINGLKG